VWNPARVRIIRIMLFVVVSSSTTRIRGGLRSDTEDASPFDSIRGCPDGFMRSLLD
jgi:hypothetical protein